MICDYAILIGQKTDHNGFSRNFQSQSKSSSTSGISSNHHSPVSRNGAEAEAEEARLKAEKIKLAIEKIKEASVKKLFVKVNINGTCAKENRNYIPLIRA